MTRWLLKLLVEVDSSRFVTTRLGAAAGLLILLGAFAAVGYWLPTAVAGYLGR